MSFDYISVQKILVSTFGLDTWLRMKGCPEDTFRIRSKTRKRCRLRLPRAGRSLGGTRSSQIHGVALMELVKSGPPGRAIEKSGAVAVGEKSYMG